MTSFEIAVSYVLGYEQGLSTNKYDRGGITKYGISLRFLSSLPPESLKKYGLIYPVNEMDIVDLTQVRAIKIYYGEFWQHAPFDMILNQDLCNYIFDMAVNLGIAPAIKCVQRAIWAVSKNHSRVVEDGILGPKTLECINYLETLLEPALRSERAGDYRLILQKYPEEEEFRDGWLKRAYQG